MPQNSAGCSVATFGPGHDALDDHRADHQRHHRIGRDAERQHRDERGLRAGIVGRFRPGDAGDGALAEFLGRVRRRAFRPCRRRRRPGWRRRRAGCRAAEPMTVPRTIGAAMLPEVVAGRQQPADLPDQHRALVLVLEIAQDLGDAEHADRDGDEVQPVGIFADAEREARRAGVDVGADEAEQQAEHDHRQRLDDRAVRQRDRRDQADDHQREILGRRRISARSPSAAARTARQGTSRRCRRRTSRSRRWPARRRRGRCGPSGSRRSPSRRKRIRPAC